MIWEPKEPSKFFRKMYERRAAAKAADPEGYEEMLKEAAEIERSEVEDKYDVEYVHWTDIDWPLPGEEE